LQYLNYPIQRDGLTIRLPGRQPFIAKPIQIPGDFSSAAFFIVAATIVPDSQIVIKNVGVNPTRTGLLDVLLEMGADIQLTNQRQYGLEPVADIEVKASPLIGIADLPIAAVNKMMDEFPIFFVACASAFCSTKIQGLAELRVKESDRLGVMSEALTKLGVDNNYWDDWIWIDGKGKKYSLQHGLFSGGKVATEGDHRIAMSLSVAGLLCQDPLIIEDCSNVGTSFPSFIECARKLNMAIETT
jgi:3-phosphoshikimate 1-carboxyvinyltransferase